MHIKKNWLSRILAIDYGRKRTGLAVTDPMGLIASGLKTIATEELLFFLKQYIDEESIQTIVIGEPRLWNNDFSSLEKDIKEFIQKLSGCFPNIHLERIDERFTSKLAQNAIITSGLKKKARQDKALIDKISAVLILQSYLDKKRTYDFTYNAIWRSYIEKKKQRS